jgi:iron(III) transport system substrate-binding protein
VNAPSRAASSRRAMSPLAHIAVTLSPAIIALSPAVVALGLAACGADVERTPLVVRTTLPSELQDFVEASFEEGHPDVDVRFTEGGPAGSFHELQIASDGAPFDVWWGAPGTVLERAADAGLLSPYRPSWVAQPGVGEPNAEDLWQAVLITPFVIALNREHVPLARAPTDWIDLFHFRWAEKVHLPDPTQSDEGAYFVGAMVTEGLRTDGDLERGFDWLDRLDTQVELYVPGSAEAINGLETGLALLSILPRADVESARAAGKDWLYYRMPESGTPMLVRGVAIVRSSEVASAAARFVDHLGRPEVATEAKFYTRWQPAHGGVDMNRFPPDFEIDQAWTPYALAIDTIAAEVDRWVMRWDLEVRGVRR